MDEKTINSNEVAEGVVEKWNTNVTAKSGKVIPNLITVNGVLYSYWNIVPTGFMVGSKIDFTYATKDVGDRQFKTIKTIKVIDTSSAGTTTDIMTPIGNIYAMCEEKLNGIIEQNALAMDLLIKIAKEMKIDIGFKKASEL